MSVLAVMRRLRSELDSGSLWPYCFIEINGLKLASPENIYKVICEQLSGHRVGWKKALHYLTEHFSDGTKIRKQANQLIILLMDELDLLLTGIKSEIKPATLVLHAVKRPAPKSIALSADEPDDASELKQEKTCSVVRKLNTDPLGKK